MMWRLLLLTAILGACDRASSKQDPTARDLSRALSTSSEPAYALSQKRRDELERCKFVYHDEQGLRECLVLKNGWTPQDAAREIAIYEGEMARALDSLQRITDSLGRYRDSVAGAERRVQDSLYGVRLRVQEGLERARLRAVQASKDSLERTRDLLNGPIAQTYPDSGPWMGDDRTGAYYRTTCEAAKRIPVDHRIYFGAENHAASAHLWPSRQPGCR